MTQDELAAEIGVESLHISCVERGKRSLSIEKLERVCKHFGISMSELMPVEHDADLALKEAWIKEIGETLKRLDMSQVGMVRMMLGALDR
jgi:transcriptional regulator with XRE-family HTH domain